MRKQILKNRFWLIAILLAAFVFSYSDAYAWGGGDHGHGHGHYYYRGGRWYDNGWFWGGAAITALTIGAMVASLPPRYEVVYVGGAPYYYCDNVYFRQCPQGYVVVPTPVIAAAPVAVQPGVVMPAAPIMPAAPVAQPQEQGAGTAVINVPNTHGTFTPVTLTKYGNGYIGPQGEYYEGNPTVEQLRTLYGK